MPALKSLHAPPEIPIAVGSLSIFRCAYDTSDWNRSLWAVPPGPSGHPGSRHYADWWRIAAAETMQALRAG